MLPVIPSNRNYWLVRTNSGKFYENFIKGSYIGIGWNKIKAEDIFINFKKDKKSLKPIESIAEKVHELYPDTQQNKHLANQLAKFSTEIKQGDIVLIPSKNSDIITFGEVESDTIYTEEVSEKEIVCEKRKEVKWLKRVSKASLDPYLYKLIYSHHTITNANEYATFIDRTINDFFVKNGEAHLILEVTTDKKINANDLFGLGNNLLNSIEDFNKVMNANLDSGNIEVKLNLNSPGKIELIGKVKTIGVVALLIVLINGGGFTVGYQDFNVDLHTDGIIKNVIEYQNNHQERELKEALTKKLDNMKVLSPDELVKLMDASTRSTTGNAEEPNDPDSKK